ncbi:MAG: exopolyphosphatase, partial [Pseudomonadota bacterium]
AAGAVAQAPRPRLPSAAGAGAAGAAAPRPARSTLTTREPWLAGLGGRSFAQPGTREGRIGVVDAGSNSVRLVVFEGASRSPAQLFNEKVTCGLGRGLAESGRLNPAGVEKALKALKRFATVAEHLEVATLAGAATAAIRDAADGRAFRDRVARETGIRLRIATGADEARLAARGVLFGDPEADGVVADLGGASLELCWLEAGRVGPGITLPLGPLRLAEESDPDAAIGRALAGVPDAIAAGAGRLILVGGAWRALARIDMELHAYPLKVLHEYEIAPEQARALVRWVRRTPVEHIAMLDGVSESRAPAMPLAARLLRGLLTALDPGVLQISAFGLREGICLDAMPSSYRRDDPLIAAAQAMERMYARMPGFGAELGHWLVRGLAPADAAEARLFRAAGYLADIRWRTHPDHRVAASWEVATRSTLTGLGHPGRAFLGLALATRYRRHRRVAADAPAAALLDEAAATRAVTLGLALRLGCSLAACSPGVLPHAPLGDGPEGLSVTIAPEMADLAGEDSDKRLAQLARHMGRPVAGLRSAGT